VFSATLRLHRERLGLTQAEAALVVDMSAEWVSKCERGLTVPPAISQEGALERLRAAKKPGTRKGHNTSVSGPCPPPQDSTNTNPRASG